MTSHKTRVLLLEDEIMLGLMYQDMLEGLGHEVVGPAVRVDEALALIETESVDLAMLDINLNGELSYRVADLLFARQVPFLFSTGFHKDRVREGYGDCPVLQKPFLVDELGRALAGLIAARPTFAGRSLPPREDMVFNPRHA